MQNNPIKCERKTYVNQDDQLTTSAQWAIKSLEKYNFSGLKLTYFQIRFFFPSIFSLLCIILIVIVVYIVIHSLAKSEMYELSPK